MACRDILKCTYMKLYSTKSFGSQEEERNIQVIKAAMQAKKGQRGKHAST
jgi:hypothetical protein